MMSHDIFISYSSKQKSIADGVCHYLEENGFKCWIAPRDIPVGSEYGDLIEEAIKKSKAVVLVFSEAASISKWVKGEINVAFTEDKPILPFRVDETEIKGGFRVMLNQMHWIDAYPHYSDKLPDLLKSIFGLLGKTSKNGDVLEEQEKLFENLFEEMREWKMRFNANVMKVLFGKIPPTEEMLGLTTSTDCFLKAGLKLTFDDLHRNGILPEGNRELEMAIFKEDFEVPQLIVTEMGEIPIDRTDVYFLGLPGSGKTCLLSGVTNYLQNYREMRYVPLLNARGVDLTHSYYHSISNSVKEHKAPRSTGFDIYSFFQLDLGPMRDRHITSFELSAEAFELFSDDGYKGSEVWESLGVGRCLKNKKPKALFILLDYSCFIGKNRRFSLKEQEECLRKSLEVFCSDGGGRSGERNCTMSQVSTLVIVITKSDRMDEEEGRPLLNKERADIAFDSLRVSYSNFLDTLSSLCRKYSINANSKTNPYEPLITTFSLGHFYIGNTVMYDDSDSERIASILLNM